MNVQIFFVVVAGLTWFYSYSGGRNPVVAFISFTVIGGVILLIVWSVKPISDFYKKYEERRLYGLGGKQGHDYAEMEARLRKVKAESENKFQDWLDSLPSAGQYRALFKLKPSTNSFTVVPQINEELCRQYELFIDGFLRHGRAIFNTNTSFAEASAFLAALPKQTPFEFPEETRFAGTWIIGASGQGKTNLMWHLIDADCKRRGTVVIMDSKGTLLNPYRGYEDVIVIDPRTTKINPFQIGQSDQAIEIIEYLFSIVASEMTEKQQSLFYPVLKLVSRVPDGSLSTFQHILTVGWRDLNLEPYIEKCDPTTRNFFLLGAIPRFDQPSYKETKNEILWRIDRLLTTELMQNVFLTSETNVDFPALLDSGKTILINNNTSQLGIQGAEFFGRFFLALTWMVATARTEVPDHIKMPVYFYIDEAQTVIANDKMVPIIFDECRSQKIALTIAHQRLNRITSSEVLDTLFNCGVRFASVDADRFAIAHQFNLDPEELKLKPHNFACYVRGKTDKAVILALNYFDLDSFPPIPASPVSLKIQPLQSPPAAPTSELEDF